MTELQAQTDVTLALTANRIVAMLADSPIVDYAVKTTEGAVEAIGEPYDTAPYGIVLNKDQGEFAQAVQGAVQSLIDDGTYLTILEKWNVQQRRDPDLRDHPAADRGRADRRHDRGGAADRQAGVRPQPIKAVPVRHPGRWVAVARARRAGGDARQHDPDQRRLPVGRRRPLPVLRAGPQRAAATR